MQPDGNSAPKFEYSALVRSLGPGLTLLAQQWCAVPEDVVQEAFLKLFHQTPFPDNPRAWMFKVVRRDALNASRSQSRRKRREQISRGERVNWFCDSIEESLDGELVTRALKSQPGPIREILVLRLWNELSFDEIAELAGISPRTASRRYQSGLQAIRSQLNIKLEDFTRG
ncbi:RNA polymerase sigma factor SigV [Stieleria neptunia]|uniref:RNA polymerase sigma factor SigV n=1 Tax=Stieleria neptunia TaxID=2527979 RepID=A0A518HZ73_9BACT|nr:sigma-70 family RNA polymerase sigma factor [Stieleria neptunia]QDV46140.1 RNA polymerase sigma factor SigV [Stieleria neptunia]